MQVLQGIEYKVNRNAIQNRNDSFRKLALIFGFKTFKLVIFVDT